MTIYKFALCEVRPIDVSDYDDKFIDRMIRTASGSVFVEPGSDKARIIEAEIEKHPTALFFRAKAIKADEENSNGDFFSEEELLRAYKSFEGVPFFTNHDNQNIENARGKIIFAEWVPEEKAVYTIAFVDREAFPHICRSIEEEYVTGVSMGCSVDYSICNICDNKAEKTDDYCWHIRERKGRKFSGKAKNVNTGEMKAFKDQPVFEYNYGIKFIELSAVVDPACESCHIEGIIPNDDYVKRVANMQNALYMIKTSAIEKQAGQEEVTELNNVLQTLEGIAINLIQNRQQVEVEFASDLVGILSELQTFVDELVGAGYSNVQGGGIPGVAEAPMGEEGAPMDMGMGGEQVMPVAEETSIPTPAGSVSGSPMKPLVQSPQLPITAPAKPMASDVDKLKRISRKIEEFGKKLGNNIKNIGEEDMAKRRTPSEKTEQRKEAVEVLSKSWNEKQIFFDHIKKMPSIQNDNVKLTIKKRDDSFIIVAENKDETLHPEDRIWAYEDLTTEERRLIKESPDEAALHLLNTFAKSIINQKEGERVMTDNIKEAGANSVNEKPEVVTEAQLEEQRDLYHGRTGEERNSITEKQLADDTGSHKRTGEQEVITEVQLQEKSNKIHPRTEDEVEVITEQQLNDDGSGTSPRKDEPKNTITQDQLGSEGYRTDTEPEVITEVQLNSVDTPWARAANRDASMFKSASEHMESVVDVLADTSISTGCTPEETCEVAGSLVSSTKERFELGNAILEDAEGEDVDYSKRLAYWSEKNIKVAGVGTKDIADAIIRGLSKIASDETVNPETVIDALDVVSEDSEGTESVSRKIDDKLEEAKDEETVKASKKDQLREALKPKADKEERDEERKEILASVEEQESKDGREAERAIWQKNIEEKKDSKEADTMIETSFQELGVSKDDEGFRGAIKGFASAACVSNKIKLAAITNVTIDGDTISIAVQTGEGEESIEIPVNSEEVAINEEELVPEADLTGEGLETAMPPIGDIAAGPVASDSSKMKREAQVPMGGGIPGTPGEVAGGSGAPEGGLPGTSPMGAEPVESLTMEEETEISDEIPTAGEQQPLGSICPECGTSDVDVTAENGEIKGNCKNPDCGAGYDALIKKNVEYKITNPSKLMGGEGDEAPEAPEVPALPVAAQTRLDKDVIVRIASNKDKYGNVCPACGMNKCKIASESDGHSEYTCPACGTDVEKDVIVNVNNPEENYLRVKWDVVPNIEGCEDCEKEAKKLVSMVRVAKMMKEASETEFPMANCQKLIANRWGGNAVATFGPCKGQPLADCVCTQLEKLGLRTQRHLEKLASVYSSEDPMDQCVEDQKGKGYDVKEAQTICNCLRKKFASESDENPFLQAFADDIESGREKVLTAQDLSVINDMLSPEVEEAPLGDVDIADAIIEEDQAEEIVGDEIVAIEVSKDTAEELADAASDAASEVEVDIEIDDEAPEVVEEIPEVVEEVPEIGLASTEDKIEISSEEEKEMALSMQTHKLRRVGEEVVKVAGTPKQVEDIEGNVEAGVPRAKATIGNEGAENIDVPMAKPDVPRAKATMGHESAENIDKPAGLPDVAVDSSYMGVNEKSNQSDMPAINNEIKGTVIAEDEEKVVKEAKQLKEVDTVEQDVEAGVPRAKATIGNEGADNVDVPMAKPDVPRANAEMGNEGADNINPKADGPDVPVDSAYMGKEKEVQKDMPAINDEYLKQVQQEHKKELQLERIANARRTKAIEVAAKLLAESRITSEAYGDVIDALSSFEIDQIVVKAETMYPKKVTKQASTTASKEVHAGAAIVIESKPEVPEDNTLADKLASHFTIGNKSFDENLTIYGEK